MKKPKQNLQQGMQPINAQTTLNAVIGYPLAHSQSPSYHAQLYKKQKLNAVMLAFPTQNLKQYIEAAKTLNIQLTAVTIPHKQAIIKFLDHIDPAAKAIGAVNTVINQNGKLTGFNTDILGIAEALKRTQLRNKNVLVLGAGGASHPLCYYLNQQHAKLMCFNRTYTKAQQLMKKFKGKALKSLDHVQAKDFDIIINTTPIGMLPNTNVSPLPKHLLAKHQTVFDIVYNPQQTKLLKQAKQAGAKTISGLVMFQAQAEKQVQLLLKHKS